MMSIPTPLSRARVQTETQITRAILTYLAACRVLAWRVNSRVVRMPGTGGRDRLVRFGGLAGMPDIAGVLPGGRACFLEGKRVGEHPTVIQTHLMFRLAAAGALVRVVNCVEDVRQALHDWGMKPLPL